ncbi:phosphate/phosphite/phosphonate ABC transporter substrate-binding protein [Tropicimonas sp. IMCC6043]|uniref:phosphate/phosphite/phosphonate ABC transporter substrate-binding protein n=1 Tax=Tropicimonas sp. IMCC6043 TaxID=2510645 RepID=UPI00101D91B9|nr:phosphate/phosphite/phosphonate ABC transporter substrate-binding protein [Tropicimonas sp. IMCC6043]RYH12372.1 phosphate/phosphite/phosphonate ABC transporter substrate-binding protein [Tropicimonas sp. IMCC6043]
MKTLLAALVATTALAVPARAQDEIKGFGIAILGGENAQERVADSTCLAQRIEDALGVPTALFTPADYDGAIEGLLEGSIDAAWLGASSYARTYLSNPDAVEPVLVGTGPDGAVSHAAIAYARRDSGIASLDDMRGKVIGFADPNALTGYLIPSVEIAALTGAPVGSGAYFGAVRFTGSYEQTLLAVASGEIDAGVAWIGGGSDGVPTGPLRTAADAGLVDGNVLVEIWRSRPIPGGPIVLRKSLPAEVKEKVTAVYAGLHERDPDCADRVANGPTAGFTPIGHDAYVSVIAARRAVSD